MIQAARVKLLAKGVPRRGDYVFYWMQASQRLECNHALEFAVRQANERRLPLLVGFGLAPRFPEATARAYYFMLEGLREVEAECRKHGIGFVAQRGSPDKVALDLGRRAEVLVTDRAYTRTERAWRVEVAKRTACHFFQVETNVVVPVEAASDKKEFMAATLRPKIHKLLNDFLVPLKESGVSKKFKPGNLESLDLSDPVRVVASLPVNKKVGPSPQFRGGTSQALKRLNLFLRRGLTSYDDNRNDPGLDGTSRLSPYLHFGQISPLAVALQVKKTRGETAAAAFLEELIVRRELAMNFTHYNELYDSYQGLPEWCRRTLGRHRRDKRRPAYSLQELEKAGTHDPYWNAAQRQMACLGWMHGHMRMYWGKKILEWSASPEEGFRTALELNNRYELDGRDPNGFAGVAWCYGLHDRPWPEHRVFGQVRTMTESGLKRKFDADRYVQKVEESCGPERR